MARQNMSQEKSSVSNLLTRVLQRKNTNPVDDSLDVKAHLSVKVHEKYTRFDTLPNYDKIHMLKKSAEHFHIENPYFRTHEAKNGAKTIIGGKEYLNFSHYNYLGLSSHEEVNQAAKDAIDKYGTSAGASRLVAGDKDIQNEFEKELAKVYEAEAALTFVSGHACNVTTLRTLFSSEDIIFHDSLIHNSIIEGIQLSGATRRVFAHNDLNALEKLLLENRGQYKRALIVAEGVYSMDGDSIDLKTLVDLKKRYQCFLMIDEAHALGILGKNGRGSFEEFQVNPNDIDIWMGTLSKTLASSGGYIAGSQVLIDILKHDAPGFVYSVGLSPVLAAASNKALEIMLREPQRVEKLRENAQYFCEILKNSRIDIGLSQGYCVVPVVLGSSRKAVSVSNKLFEAGINVQPIIHPAVEDKGARLRFFLSSMHTKEDLDIVSYLLKKFV